VKNDRPNPDQLLASVQKEEAKQRRGKLKIFLGMCPGVGKTYAMLQAARQRQAEGCDMLVGVAETHNRAETKALLEGLAIASKVKKEYRGTLLEEMDLDAILAIRPQLALVDELAHTNIPGSRHPKRYQDVLELLDAGIDVYTTLNVQHVESRAEAVRQITGIKIQETVPDSLLDDAEEVVLIDLSPEQLRQRLKEGKVYLGERAVTAAENFFREENLTALREMALRLTAECVTQDLREIMTEQNIRGPWKSGERLMVAVGATPYSESLIRWTRKSAAALNAPWLAVYIESSQNLDEEDKTRLTRNLNLARQLGAEVLVRSGADLAEALLHVARENNVSQICVGKPAGPSWLLWLRGGRSLVQRLIRDSGDIDIHLIRIKSLGGEKSKSRKSAGLLTNPREVGAVMAIVSAVTLLCLGIEHQIGYTSVSMIYLLAVLLSGMTLSRWPVLLLGMLSALTWNFVFIPPRYTFQISKTNDVMMFIMFFIVALVMGQITTRLRERKQSERKQEARLHTLYDLTRMMAVTHEARDAIHSSIEKIQEVLQVQAAIFLTDAKGRPDFSKPAGGTLILSGKERSVATWAFQKQQPAGRFTDNLPDATHHYQPLVSMEKSLGVLVIHPVSEKTWSLEQRNLIDTFSSLMTVILEKEMLSSLAEETKIKAELEKLYTALLDSVSHELKTPLAVIEGCTETLSPELFRKLIPEIRMASKRLRQTVDGLLEMTRLDSGSFQLNMEWHDMRDVINAAVERLTEQLSKHTVKLQYADKLPLVKIDARIIEQVLVNLLSNAVLYTPQGTEITVTAQTDQEALLVSVMDQGEGIPEEDFERIFEKFYRGRNTITGGLGLGLSIAKRFIQAHGGEIEARNQPSGGACFTFRLPTEFFHGDSKELE